MEVMYTPEIPEEISEPEVVANSTEEVLSEVAAGGEVSEEQIAEIQ